LNPVWTGHSAPRFFAVKRLPTIGDGNYVGLSARDTNLVSRSS
jgi:hypothetical protein